MPTFTTIHLLADGTQCRRQWEADNLAHTIGQVQLADFGDDETLIGVAEREAIEDYAVNPATGEVFDASVILLALDTVAEALGDQHTAGDVAGRFTCCEADSIAAVLAYAGHVDAAVTWIEGHADGDDDPEDAHAHIKALQTDGLGGDESMAASLGYVANLTMCAPETAA